MWNFSIFFTGIFFYQKVVFCSLLTSSFNSLWSCSEDWRSSEPYRSQWKLFDNRIATKQNNFESRIVKKQNNFDNRVRIIQCNFDKFSASFITFLQNWITLSSPLSGFAADSSPLPSTFCGLYQRLKDL